MIVSKAPVDQRSVAAHYDNLDRFYREMWGEHVHHGLWLTGRETPQAAVVQLIQRVAQHARLEKGARVCDIGCGYGGTSRWLAREYAAEVTGLTISPAQQAYAAGLDRSAVNPTYLLRDWLANELPAAEYDVCIAIESSEHMEDKQRFFTEAARVLKPGGRLVVCAWLARPRASRWEVDYLLEPICREGRLPGMGTPAEYRALAAAAGFSLVQYEDVSGQVSKTWAICARRVVAGVFQNAAYRRFLFQRSCSDRVFAATVFRIMTAYAVGAMRYGILSATRR